MVRGHLAARAGGRGEVAVGVVAERGGPVEGVGDLRQPVAGVVVVGRRVLPGVGDRVQFVAGVVGEPGGPPDGVLDAADQPRGAVLDGGDVALGVALPAHGARGVGEARRDVAERVGDADRVTERIADLGRLRRRVGDLGGLAALVGVERHHPVQRVGDRVQCAVGLVAEHRGVLQRIGDLGGLVVRAVVVDGGGAGVSRSGQLGDRLDVAVVVVADLGAPVQRIGHRGDPVVRRVPGDRRDLRGRGAVRGGVADAVAGRVEHQPAHLAARIGEGGDPVRAVGGVVDRVDRVARQGLLVHASAGVVLVGQQHVVARVRDRLQPAGLVRVILGVVVEVRDRGEVVTRVAVGDRVAEGVLGLDHVPVLPGDAAVGVAVVGQPDPPAVRRGDLPDRAVGVHDAVAGGRWRDVAGDRDRVAELVADGLQRRLVAEDVGEPVAQPQVPAVAVPRQCGTVERGRCRVGGEHRVEVAVRWCATGADPVESDPAAVRQDQPAFVEPVGGVEVEAVGEVGADAERPVAGVALLVGAGQVDRQHVGGGEVLFLVDEQAGGQVDGVGAALAAALRVGLGRRERVRRDQHGAGELVDLGALVRLDPLAVAGHLALAVDEPALAGRVVVPEVHPCAGGGVGEVRVDDPGAFGKDVRAARLHREIGRHLRARQRERRTVHRDRGDAQLGDDLAVHVTHDRAGRQSHLEPRNVRGADGDLAGRRRGELHRVRGVELGEPDRVRQDGGLARVHVDADVVQTERAPGRTRGRAVDPQHPVARLEALQQELPVGVRARGDAFDGDRHVRQRLVVEGQDPAAERGDPGRCPYGGGGTLREGAAGVPALPVQVAPARGPGLRGRGGGRVAVGDRRLRGLVRRRFGQRPVLGGRGDLLGRQRGGVGGRRSARAGGGARQRGPGLQGAGRRTRRGVRADDELVGAGAGQGRDVHRGRGAADEGDLRAVQIHVDVRVVGHRHRRPGHAQQLAGGAGEGDVRALPEPVGGEHLRRVERECAAVLLVRQGQHDGARAPVERHDGQPVGAGRRQGPDVEAAGLAHRGVDDPVAGRVGQPDQQGAAREGPAAEAQRQPLVDGGHRDGRVDVAPGAGRGQRLVRAVDRGRAAVDALHGVEGERPALGERLDRQRVRGGGRQLGEGQPGLGHPAAEHRGSVRLGERRPHHVAVRVRGHVQAQPLIGGAGEGHRGGLADPR